MFKLKYIYGSRSDAECSIDMLEMMANDDCEKYKLDRISVNQVYAYMDEINFMPEGERDFIDEKRGWFKENFVPFVNSERHLGYTTYQIALPDPVNIME